jgi:hypothetical protein
MMADSVLASPAVEGMRCMLAARLSAQGGGIIATSRAEEMHWGPTSGPAHHHDTRRDLANEALP